ncbi:Zinc finger protein [Fusarium oxysporum f. sp. albedinis]|nr:Zinc finger protein [Fusarium oxysporum f. sp. albedinis]
MPASDLLGCNNRDRKKSQTKTGTKRAVDCELEIVDRVLIRELADSIGAEASDKWSLASMFAAEKNKGKRRIGFIWGGGKWLDNWDGGSNAVPPQARRKHREESEGMSGVTYRIETRESLGKRLSDKSNKKRDI